MLCGLEGPTDPSRPQDHPAASHRTPRGFRSSVLFSPLVSRSFLVLALSCLGFVAWTRLESLHYQRTQGQALDAMRAARRAHPPAPRGRRAARVGNGVLIGRIEIPRRGISAIVAQGTDPRTLRRAVGHLPETPLPGEPGNVALAGHRDSFFRSLKNVRKGDGVWITTPDGVYEYRVVATSVVGPKETDILDSSKQDTLTLITCFPFQYVGPAPQRYIVSAQLVDEAPPDDDRPRGKL